MAQESMQHRRKPSGAASHGRKKSQAPRAKVHSRRENRESSSARGYDHRWEKFRKAFLVRNPLCEYCLARGRVEPATVCDHDLPHENDQELFWNNTFTALCKHDHDSTKQRMERRFKGDVLLREVRRAKGEL